MVKHTGYGHKAEIWSLGILLHELLSGDAPFVPSGPEVEEMKASEKLMALFKMIVKQRPALDAPCFAQSAVADMLRSLLQKQATKRISIAEVRSHPFFQGFHWGAFRSQQLRPPWVPPPHPKLPPGAGPRRS